MNELNKEIPRYNQNQTQFSVEEPLLEEPPTAQPMAEATEATVTANKPKLPRWAWWAIGAASLLLILIVLMVLNRPPQPSVLEEEEQLNEIAPEFNPLEQRLRAAENLLKQTNPTSEKYPFPPVSATLKIDR